MQFFSKCEQDAPLSVRGVTKTERTNTDNFAKSVKTVIKRLNIKSICTPEFETIIKVREWKTKLGVYSVYAFDAIHKQLPKIVYVETLHRIPIYPEHQMMTVTSEENDRYSSVILSVKVKFLI